ncbi:MAG: VWA domain-containing protein [Desulfobacterales bacterium]
MLTKKILIIVGDARTNYHNPCERLLDEMRAKCRRVIWLNPEPEQFWGTGDSEMNTYKSYCHEVRPTAEPESADLFYRRSGLLSLTFAFPLIFPWHYLPDAL